MSLSFYIKQRRKFLIHVSLRTQYIKLGYCSQKLMNLINEKKKGGGVGGGGGGGVLGQLNMSDLP